ncbi:hypothetical protein BHU72_03895 [Desulfuribacillus stibiiarsenatis]|uniref:Indole-3-glycerol phosphate synthase n=1 Tax=Desulfuribacillus stibiiarsenatis TaxID=1390249 RepID=A0A1E5L7I2_9FIRM|nr:indole-3-glycerol phosphate synthase TrpC [Desulfuribacillus stibiiarsenatis]OEH85923.1 hypothetical protein BHU72_03895 [Desulfuribacillus stibiiarsenatis]
MILDKIVEQKKLEVEALKELYQGKNYQKLLTEVLPVRNFYQNLKEHSRTYPLAIIAEVKKASPSKGIIKEDFDPIRTANEYASNAVAAISVLTDSEFFKGSFEYLKAIRSEVNLPLLCKDFIISPYQIIHARKHGADAILLIAKILEKEDIQSLYQFATDLGMDCLIEIHDGNDLDKALTLDAKIIGINNRDLDTFETHLRNTEKWIKHIPQHIIKISESGIDSKQDSQTVRKYGANGILVGESLMRSNSIANKIKELRLEELMLNA